MLGNLRFGRSHTRTEQVIDRIADGIETDPYLTTLREAEITAVYVSDMGAALSWVEPGPGNWIAADGALFVTGARVAGGMGAPELVPFATPEAAARFIARHGGQALPLNDIPDAAVLGPVDLAQPLATPVL